VFTASDGRVSSAADHDQRPRGYPDLVPLLANPIPQTTGRRSVWINGQLHLGGDEPTVSATDHGLVVGDGVFEALKVTASGAFAVRRHLARLTRSAAALGLPAPDHDLLREAIEAVLADRDFIDGKLRITYTGGAGPLGSPAAYGPPTLIVASEASPHPPATTAVVTAPWSRNEHGALAGVKSISYAENVRALAWAAAQGAGEAIFLNPAGNVCEGTGTNIFCVFGHTVVTPPLTSGALAGITRELLLEWCEIIERDITPTEALAADEVFITSSLRDVQSVDQWGTTAFGPERPATERISRSFAERAWADPDP
jgi:branched-chain amino acid aminotransferase